MVPALTTAGGEGPPDAGGPASEVGPGTVPVVAASPDVAAASSPCPAPGAAEGAAAAVPGACAGAFCSTAAGRTPDPPGRAGAVDAPDTPGL
eukprot:2675797-Alexandrium_andersonii.AAC.1